MIGGVVLSTVGDTIRFLAFSDTVRAAVTVKRSKYRRQSTFLSRLPFKEAFFNFCQISERGQRCLLAVCLNSKLFSLQEGFAKEVARYIIAVAYANKTLQDALGHHLARARFLYI